MPEAEPHIVIEGFPRSGNTFLSFAVRYCWPGIKGSSHTHEVPKSIRDPYSKPVIVPVREPFAACISYGVLLKGTHSFRPELRISLIIDKYIDWMTAIINSDKLIPVLFDDFTSDIESTINLIDSIYSGFGLPPRVFPVDEEEVKRRLMESDKRFKKDLVAEGSLPREKHLTYDYYLSEFTSDRYKDRMSLAAYLYGLVRDRSTERQALYLGSA